MIETTLRQSAIYSSLPKLPGIFESQIIISCLNLLNQIFKLILNIFSTSSIVKIVSVLPWKSILIFLFILSLTIAPESQLQLSTLNSANFDTSPLNQRQFGIVIFSLSNIILLFLIAIFIHEYHRRRTNSILHTFEIVLLIFLILAQISVITSVNTNASFVWFLKLMFCVTIYFIFSRITLTKKQLHLIIYVFAITILLEGLLAGMQFIRGDLIGLHVIESLGKIDVPRISTFINGNRYLRVVGTFSHPNLLSAYIGILLPLNMLLLFNKNRSIKILGFLTIIVAMTTLFLTLSRWEIIVGIFALILTFFLYKKLLGLSVKQIVNKMKENKIFLRIIGLSIAIIVVLLFTNPFIARRFFQFSLDDQSLVTRLDLLSQALYAIHIHPFGIGGGVFPIYLANNDATGTFVSQRFLAPVHNFYLLMTAETGILDISVFFFFVFMLTKFFVTSLPKLTIDNKLIAAGLFASLIIFLFDGLWEPRSFSNRVGFVLFLQLGLLVNIIRSYSWQRQQK